MHPGHALLSGARVGHQHHQVEREVGDVGERMALAHGQGGEDREDRAVRTGPRGGPGPRRRGCASRTAPPRPQSAPARPGRRSTRLWRATSSVARSVMATSCSLGPIPSGERVRRPAATWSSRPATRTWKNSSSPSAKMPRNLTRSSRGRRSSATRSRSRAAKSSQDSSRLMNRPGSSSPLPGPRDPRTGVPEAPMSASPATGHKGPRRRSGPRVRRSPGGPAAGRWTDSRAGRATPRSVIGETRGRTGPDPPCPPSARVAVGRHPGPW